MHLPLSSEEFIRCVIAFVDDTDFYTNNEDFQEKMQLLMDMYTRLYEATGGGKYKRARSYIIAGYGAMKMECK